MLDRVDFVSGVSGGSVTAAYFGLKQRAALDDFRERFLLRNAEEGLKTQISLGNIGRALGGGVNDSQFTDWLDHNLFNGAQLRGVAATIGRPRVWINASDIYNRTPVRVRQDLVRSRCAATSALSCRRGGARPRPRCRWRSRRSCCKPFPAAAPRRCRPWLERARNDPNAQPLLRSYAEAQARYRDGSMRYVKLLDGGLVDNYGLSALQHRRCSAAQRPYEPLSERQAAKLRRILFLVVDAGRGISGDFGADARRAERRRTGVGGRRHRDRCQRAVELRGVHRRLPTTGRAS